MKLRLKIVILKFQLFLRKWSFNTSSFPKLPKYTKLVQISKSQYFNLKYAIGTIYKHFSPLKAKLRSILGSNIAPKGRGKIIFVSHHTEYHILKSQLKIPKTHFWGICVMRLFGKAIPNRNSQPSRPKKVNGLH